MPLTAGRPLLENYYRTIFIGVQRLDRASRSAPCCSTRFVMAMGDRASARSSSRSCRPMRSSISASRFAMTAFWVIFITLMLPVEVRIYPTYKIVADLGMLDTYTGPDPCR